MKTQTQKTQERQLLDDYLNLFGIYDEYYKYADKEIIGVVNKPKSFILSDFDWINTEQGTEYWLDRYMEWLTYYKIHG